MLQTAKQAANMFDSLAPSTHAQQSPPRSLWRDDGSFGRITFGQRDFSTLCRIISHPCYNMLDLRALRCCVAGQGGAPPDYAVRVVVCGIPSKVASRLSACYINHLREIWFARFRPATLIAALAMNLSSKCGISWPQRAQYSGCVHLFLCTFRTCLERLRPPSPRPSRFAYNCLHW
jgi:hypothetical protein